MLAKRIPARVGLERIYADYQSYWTNLLRKWWYIIIGIAMAAIAWGSEAVSMKIISELMGEDIPFAVVLVAAGAGLLTLILPLTPGNIGVFEVAVATFMAFYGVDFDTGVVIALVHHVMSIVVLTVVGVPSLYRIGLDTMEMEQSIEEAASAEQDETTVLSSISEEE